MTRSWNLEEGCFLDQYGEQPLVTARFNFYPPCPRPDRILGAKPHADASAVTFLLQAIKIKRDLSVRKIMADNLCPTKLESKSKSVQELVRNSEEPPGKYFYEDGVHGVLDSSLPVLEIPVIDTSRLTSPSTSREEVEKLRSALISCGCFVSINHGVTGSFLDQIRSVTTQFFAFPMEEKMKYSREVDTPEARREILQEHTTKLKVIVEVVLKAMARSLNLEDNCYLEKYGERALMQARFNFFPPCPRPDRSLGLKPHADRSAITIVLQNKEVEGLQFLKDDQWFRVPIQLPHALLINVGDQSEYGEHPLVTARFKFYPPCPRPDRILGVKPHADASAVTFLLQDKEMEGLQFLKDNEWFRVPISPHAHL
ncbi:hypothetical protein H0E87_029280 [Populus deltoides]|uniref:Fe2OG dioxygenase domain-containing protein n=1 Tax=Populus deltoides TaxID=3696 RepID=A0A8T2WLI8_POPDE|nr:hypothetical protein H0E87_029280 [Populus deltoides]